MTLGHRVIPSHEEGTAQSSWTLACKTTLRVSRGSVTQFPCKDQISTQKQDHGPGSVSVFQLKVEEGKIVTAAHRTQ